MRLWSLGLLALVLVGSLIAIARTGLFDALLGRNRPLTYLQFADFERGSIEFLDADGPSVFVAQAHPSNPLILSGLPSFSSKMFRLPTDSRPRSGVYFLAFNVDAAQGTEGAMRVTINGIRRADVLIGEGRHREAVEIELTPSELSASQLEVRLALVGRGPLEECTPGEAMAAVATVLPESGLQLELDDPLSTIRDRLALWGDLVPIEWRGSEDATATATLIAASRLVEKGYRVYFDESGLIGDVLDATVKAAPNRTVSRAILYPAPLVDDLANAGVRRFDRETVWRYRYNAADLPDGELPSALDLRMLMGPLQGTRTTLTVDLNGRLLFTRRLDEASERFSQSITLPAADHLAHNELAIALTAHDENELRCGAHRMIAAELLPETVLRGGGERLALPIEDLRALLTDAQPAVLTGHPASRPDAQASALLLAQLAPSRLRFAENGARTTIRILTGDVAAALAKLPPSNHSWVLHAATDRREGVVIEPLGSSPRGSAAHVAMLITVDNTVSVPATLDTPAPAVAFETAATGP